MTKLEIMHRAKELKKKINELSEAEKKYDELTGDCKHEVILVTYMHPWVRRVDATCIFCGKTFWKDDQVSNCTHHGSKIANVSKFCEGNVEKDLEEAQEIAGNMLRENPNASAKNLVEVIEDKFEKRAY